MIFHVSMDSGTKDGEIPEEREARLAKNGDHQRCRDDKAAQDANGQDANQSSASSSSFVIFRASVPCAYPTAPAVGQPSSNVNVVARGHE
jgi:hypothetical protein